MIDLTRRDFLKDVGITTTAFVVGIQLPLRGRKAFASETKFSTHYVVIGSQDGEFIFTMDKAEMGQGVITGQLTLLCEEADIDPASFKIVSAPVDSVYGTMGGLQITGGSTSTQQRWLVLRQAGANIRGIFLKAAAKKWSQDVTQLTTNSGFVVNSKTGERISYNELASLASGISVKDQPLKDSAKFKYIGKSGQKADAHDKSMGLAEFGIDFKTENLLTAVVLRSPSFGGQLKSFDKTAAMQVPGVKHVVEISSGLAVVGEKYWQVAKARDLISIDWEKGINKNVSSKDIQVQYKKALAEDGGKEVHSVGDLNEALSAAKSDEILDVEYDLPYLAHTCMEPMNAAAQVSKERADIWSPNQAPTLIRNAAADFLQLPRDRVFVHTTKYLGGGFGRRSTLDYSMEAVELAQKINNPVKIIWSREDDTRHSPMRPINRHRFRGLIKEGKAIAWEHRLACESIMQGAMPKWVPLMLPGWIPSVLREGIGSTTDAVFKGFDLNLVTAEGTHLDYSIPNVRVSLRNIDLNIPIHFWRSVGHSYNGFVVESFIDELAHKAKKDPYAFRKDLLTQNPRASGVLNEVARISNWQQPLPAGRARGIAYHFSFQSYVAEVAEVEIKDAQVQVKKVYCAVDCGVAVNPDIVVDQMKSGIIYGLSAALSGEITLNEGGVQQSNFHDYPVLRMSETPDIEVSIVSSDNAPTGVGEPGLPPIAAAVGNAIFSLTGKRLRSLPFKL